MSDSAMGMPGSATAAPAAASTVAAWRRHGMAFAVLLALLVASRWPVVVELVSVWARTTTFNHCFLIPLISAWLVWERRGDLVGVEPHTSLLGVGAIALLVPVAIAGDLFNIQVLEHVALVGSLQGLLLAVFGTAVVYRLFFPVAFLAFMVPVGDELIPVLMAFTADFTVGALQWFGIPVFRQGMYFELTSGLFEVAEACSGIRYMLASLAVGALYANLLLRTLHMQALFIVLAALVPILANGLRALGIVLLAHYSDMALATGVDHFIYGWVFFGIVMLGMLWLAGRLARLEGEPAPALATRATAVPAAPAAAWRLPVHLLVAAVVVLLPALRPAAGPAPAELPTAAGLPTGIPGWIGPLPHTANWQPAYRGADEQLSGRYRSDAGPEVALRQWHWWWQAQDKEMVNLDNLLLPDGARELGRVELPPDADVPWPRVAVDVVFENGRALTLWTWYRVDGEVVTSPFAAKLVEARTALGGGAADGVLFVLAAGGHGAAAAEALQGWASSAGERVVQCSLPVDVARDPSSCRRPGP